jgi:hypothetical protein
MDVKADLKQDLHQVEPILPKQGGGGGLDTDNKFGTSQASSITVPLTNVLPFSAASNVIPLHKPPPSQTLNLGRSRQAEAAKLLDLLSFAAKRFTQWPSRPNRQALDDLKSAYEALMNKGSK